MVLNIVLWLWKGWRPVYDRRDVLALVRQLHAHGDLPSDTRIICLTDRPTDWDKPKVAALGVLEFPIWPELPFLSMGELPNYAHLPPPRGTPNCFRRLKLFDPDIQASLGIQPGDIIMSMDLDAIVAASLRPLLAPFYAEDPVDFMAMDGRVSRLHGALWAFRAGTHRYVWDTFDPRTSPVKLKFPPRGIQRYIGSDQAWLSTVLPADTKVWTTKDAVWSWPRHHLEIKPAQPIAYMSFAGNQKPRGAACAMATPWVHAHAMRYWEE